MFEYEMFKIKPHKSIIQMTNRLNTLLTILGKLGKHYSRKEVNTKILRVLLKKDQELKVTLIEEALIGKLLTHELTLRQREEEHEDKEKNESLTLKAL